MLLQRATIFRLEPTSEQAIALLGGLAHAGLFSISHLSSAAIGIVLAATSHTHQQRGELTKLRAEVDWLRAVPVHALQMAVRAVDSAFQRFLAGLGGYQSRAARASAIASRCRTRPISASKRLNKTVAQSKCPRLVGSRSLVGVRSGANFVASQSAARPVTGTPVLHGARKSPIRRRRGRHLSSA